MDEKDIDRTMSDLVGLGKIAESLLDKVASATGSLLEPWQLRRVARAQADGEHYATIRQVEAEIEADRLRRGAMATDDKRDSVASSALQSSSEAHRTNLDFIAADLRERAGRRLITRETARQRNIEVILSEGLHQAEVNEREGGSARLIDDDWIMAFIDYAQNISEKHVRSIWARILAEQATASRPKISRATLDSLRLIEGPQAAVFESAARIFLAFGQIMDLHPFEADGFNMNQRESMALEELGFLKRGPSYEASLEFHECVFTFWVKRFISHGYGGGVHEDWLQDEKARVQMVEAIREQSTGDRSDIEGIRRDIRVDRFLLTSRGYELAAILIPGFYESLGQPETLTLEQAGRYADVAVRDDAFKQWASELSARGVRIVRNIVAYDVRFSDRSRTNLLPTHIYDDENLIWLDF